MRKLALIGCIAGIYCSNTVFAQETPMVMKDILILRSTKDYAAALETARQAAARLHIRLDLGGYRPSIQSGLTLSKVDCAKNGLEYPAYIARGREYKSSNFVSIEYSNGYPGFTKGYYLVVAAIGQPGSAVVRQATLAARECYSDAFAKRTRVWVGCIH